MHPLGIISVGLEVRLVHMYSHTSGLATTWFTFGHGMADVVALRKSMSEKNIRAIQANTNRPWGSQRFHSLSLHSRQPSWRELYSSCSLLVLQVMLPDIQWWWWWPFYLYPTSFPSNLWFLSLILFYALSSLSLLACCIHPLPSRCYVSHLLFYLRLSQF